MEDIVVKHVMKLKRLIELEEAEEARQIEEELKDLSPMELQMRGRALLDMEIVEEHANLAGHTLLAFKRRHDEPLPRFTLEIGDPVIVFSHRGIGHNSPSGTVYEKSPDTLTVAFQRQLPEWVWEDDAFHIYRSTNRVTYERMHAALDAVAGARDNRLAFFRNVSLGQRKLTLPNDPPDVIAWFDDSLNDSQRAAVSRALSVDDVFLVHGPPGTGKTTVLVEIIRQHIHRDRRAGWRDDQDAGQRAGRPPGRRRDRAIFVAAPSNTACDNLLEKLTAVGVNAVRMGHPARISRGLREHTFDFQVALHPLGRELAERERELHVLFDREDRRRARGHQRFESAQELRDDIAHRKREIKALRQAVLDAVMSEAEVFIGTLASSEARLLQDLEFDLVVIDEATQATEPMTWIPLLRAGKVVMAGDHFQLPPTVRSLEAEAGGLGVTLFERLHRTVDDTRRILLERQYRMHELIMGFSSEQFYGGQLVADESVRRHTLADLPGVARSVLTEQPVRFIDTAGKGFEELLEEGSESRYNPEEADLVLVCLRQLLERGVPPSEIAVISPYSAQVRWLASKSPDAAIEINSVDGFQGREKEAVIVSLVRSNFEGEMGFLVDTRRMNVAMTRARRALIVIGDSATIGALEFYKQFLAYVERIGAYTSAWEL